MTSTNLIAAAALIAVTLYATELLMRYGADFGLQLVFQT